MHAPREISNDVLFGPRGWMFLWQGRQFEFEHLMGRTPAENSVMNFTQNILDRASTCSNRSIPYVHIVFPTKPVVMAAELPSYFQERICSIFERHYRLNVAEAGLSDICIYPDVLLKSINKTNLAFRKQDTHMSAIGDAAVSSMIIGKLGWEHDPQNYMHHAERHKLGDLARMAGISEPTPERLLFPNDRTYKIWDNRQSLPSNTNNIVIAHSPFSVSERRLLAFGDSFLLNCVSSLSTYFRDILYVRSAQFQPELLDLFSPDAVVTGNAERYLSKVLPDSSGESIVMRGYGRAGYEPSPEFSAALRAQLSWNYYRQHYNDWHQKVNILSFSGLGTGRPNDQLIHKGDELGWLESVGSDPNITFHDADLDHERNYLLRISLDVDTSGIAQLFIGNATGRRSFTEEFSIRAEVKAGRNLLNFTIPAEGRSRQLRFDPINSPGRLRISEMELKRL